MPAVYKLEKSAQWVGPLQKMPAKSPILPPSLLEAYDTRKKCLKHKESVDENTSKGKRLTLLLECFSHFLSSLQQMTEQSRGFFICFLKKDPSSLHLPHIYHRQG